MLLVLDNVEHLLPHASDEVAKLAAVAGPVVVVTSRERLQVQGEQVYPVPTLQEREAVELFHARALAITPDFREDGSVARLCARLDHLPLALELAAARTVVFSPAQLLDRLSERLDLLRGARDADPRQQTLRATIEWSYELLGGSESALFRRLSVFRGGCTIEAAEAICGADVDDLQSLIDKSLVRRRDSSQGPRFWMLETIREYADEQLEAAGEATAIRHAHADWFVERAERQAIVATAGDVMVLDLERDNMRTAFWWSIEAVPQLAARLAIANHQYWHVRDAFTEATESYAAVLEHVDTLDPLLVGRVQLADGAARFFMSDVDGAQARMDSALRFVTGQPEEIEAVRVLGYVMESRDEPRAAIELHERALALSETFDDRYQRRRSLHALGGAYALAGELETANALGEEAVAIGLADGDDLFIAHAAHNLGDFALRAGDLEEASTRYRQAAAAGRRVGSARTGAYCLAGLAAVAERRGDREEAARLWGTVEAYEDASGTRMNSHERTLYEGILDEAAREHPDAYATGRALMLDEALDAVIDAT